VASIAATAATVIGWVLAPDPMTQTLRPVPKPFPLHGAAGTVADTIHWVGWGVLFACNPVAAVDQTMQPTHAWLWLRPPAVSPRPTR
jgi:hypothetical protein